MQSFLMCEMHTSNLCLSTPPPVFFEYSQFI